MIACGVTGVFKRTPKNSKLFRSSLNYAHAAATVHVGPFVLDADRGSLTRDGHAVAMGHKGLLLLNTRNTALYSTFVRHLTGDEPQWQPSEN
jgi:hypothetical protein